MMEFELVWIQLHFVNKLKANEDGLKLLLNIYWSWTNPGFICKQQVAHEHDEGLNEVIVDDFVKAQSFC